MPKDDQNVDIVIAEEFLEALAEALWDDEWNFEPVGFLPCLCIQQVVEELERQDGFLTDEEHGFERLPGEIDSTKVS